MSCSSAACADALDLDLVQAEAVGHGPRQLDDRLGVLARVAVALARSAVASASMTCAWARNGFDAALGRACRGACAAVGAGAVQAARWRRPAGARCVRAGAVRSRRRPRR